MAVKNTTLRVTVNIVDLPQFETLYAQLHEIAGTTNDPDTRTNILEALSNFMNG